MSLPLSNKPKYITGIVKEVYHISRFSRFRREPAFTIAPTEMKYVGSNDALLTAYENTKTNKY